MEKNEIPKAYEASLYENKIYLNWEESGYFNPDQLPGTRKETFFMVLPPPNVTGTLHMGHAAMLAIEDVMVRFARLQGKKTLWLPGTDHAAIATQTKVEKILLKEEGKTRHDLGREVFLEKVSQFAQNSHDIIIDQTKKMGSSLDWSREAFTLDKKRNQSVRQAFKMMYEDKLIYRGDKVVNWCPRCQSTLSDDELEHQEKIAQLVTFKYDQDFPIAISTTRLETKLGDVAVAVNPQDERYQQYIGQEFSVNFLGQNLKIKVIADEEVDMTFGTGALGVTPAHSKTDEMMAIKNNLPLLKVINEEGKMTEQAGLDFVGLTVLEARKKILVLLEKNNLVEKIEDSSQNLSICYRCGTAVEPLPKLQWFIDVNQPFVFKQSTRHPIKGVKVGEEITLKQIMRRVVEEKEIEIIPERFTKTYFHWIDNLRDWNFSRQIWYGHQVPVWYKGEEMIVGDKPQEAGWVQDTDTLDTWFSSGLWTISTLGWPEVTEDLKTFHPSQVLETGYDILFFWVARMILMTTYAVGEIPFEKVYLHGLVRDDQGRKMSKSLDNVINPLEMIKNYGADATRLSLLIGSTPGNDVKLSEEKISSYRNFTNKLWNISRFILSSVVLIEKVEKVQEKTLADQWILHRLTLVHKQVTELLEKNELSLAGEKLRDFTWSELADWYLEVAKIQKQNKSLEENTDQILLFILEKLLIMWHPFMPFVTEQLWQYFNSDDLLIVAEWPKDLVLENVKSDQDWQIIKNLIVSIRNLRAQYKIEPARKDLSILIVTQENKDLLKGQLSVIKTLARLNEVEIKMESIKPDNSASIILEGMIIYLSLTGVVDLEQEKKRLSKEKEETKKYLNTLQNKLNNQEMLAKAPAVVLDKLKQKEKEAQEKIKNLDDQLNNL